MSVDDRGNSLPTIHNAKLPGVYTKAQQALERCQKIDECKSWADRASALASYARQAEDDSLRVLATRIQARAIRRCGVLLKQVIRPEQGGRPKKNGSGTGPVSRKAAAESAGLSKRQQRDALRVASIPTRAFERQVESDDPPTVTKLAEQGKKVPDWMLKMQENAKRPGFKQATRALGMLREFETSCHGERSLQAR